MSKGNWYKNNFINFLARFIDLNLHNTYRKQLNSSLVGVFSVTYDCREWKSFSPYIFRATRRQTWPTSTRERVSSAYDKEKEYVLQIQLPCFAGTPISLLWITEATIENRASSAFFFCKKLINAMKNDWTPYAPFPFIFEHLTVLRQSDGRRSGPTPN